LRVQALASSSDRFRYPWLPLDQQDHAREHAGVFAQAFHHDLGADQRLDPLATRFLVELDRAEQIAQVGDGQRGLAVGRRGADDVIDAVGAVDDGEFGVQAQVDKHATDCRSRLALTPAGS
jgi:hypothetical protein